MAQAQAPARLVLLLVSLTVWLDSASHHHRGTAARPSVFLALVFEDLLELRDFRADLMPSSVFCKCWSASFLARLETEDILELSASLSFPNRY